MSDAADPSIPSQILGRRIIGVCPECKGEGLLWECDDEVTTHWADRCNNCNCVGFILDLPECWKKQGANTDQSEDVPF